MVSPDRWSAGLDGSGHRPDDGRDDEGGFPGWDGAAQDSWRAADVGMHQ